MMVVERNNRSLCLFHSTDESSETDSGGFTVWSFPSPFLVYM